jgi:predicted alpha/beta superfamily hydrolase
MEFYFSQTKQKPMKLIFFTLLFLPSLLIAQTIDTLIIHSEAFDQERSVYVHKHDLSKYLSDKVEVPVIYVMDGQHEWFTNPVLNNLKYLSTTHEIPFALVVVIPHTDRYTECGIDSLDGPALPLHTFITEEVEAALAPYHPGSYRMIIGHSFTASFSLYSYLRSDGFYSAVLAHSPLDSFEKLAEALESNPTVAPSAIAISIGGYGSDKDGYHRAVYDATKAKHPAFFESIYTYEANESTHTAVPIVANPNFLSKFFYTFSRRYSDIAVVDLEYKLAEAPGSVEEEMKKIEEASKVGSAYYPAEIDEINGLASRYWNSDYEDHTIAVYEEGIKHHPNYYDFHVQLYVHYAERNPEKAKMHLKKAHELAEAFEQDEPYYEELLDEIKAEIQDNGWE